MTDQDAGLFRALDAEAAVHDDRAFVADEGADVGLDAETNVSPDYKQNANSFTGKIISVTVEQK